MREKQAINDQDSKLNKEEKMVYLPFIESE